MTADAEVPGWVEILGPEPLADGTYDAVCTHAVRCRSAAGNPGVKWTFVLDGGATLTRLTPTLGPGAVYLHATVQALGLPATGLRLSQATGRRCVLVVKTKKGWLSVDQVLPA